MKLLTYFLIVALALSLSAPVVLARDSGDDSDEGGGSGLGSAIIGGLLGGGLGTAIGSASGNAGKGAMIGAGIGAVGGLLMGNAKDEQAKRDRQYADKARREDQRYQEAQYVQASSPAQAPQIPKDQTARRKIVRQYDADGNVISEKEVPVN